VSIIKRITRDKGVKPKWRKTEVNAVAHKTEQCMCKCSF